MEKYSEELQIARNDIHIVPDATIADFEKGVVEGVGSKYLPRRGYRIAGTTGPVDMQVGLGEQQ